MRQSVMQMREQPRGRVIGCGVVSVRLCSNILRESGNARTTNDSCSAQKLLMMFQRRLCGVGRIGNRRFLRSVHNPR
jgi:hypothetical protein